MMRMLTKIDHVNLVVRDLPGMIAFYTNVLGLTVSKSVTISGPWIESVVGLKDVCANVVYLELPQGPRVEMVEYLSPLGDRPAGVDQPHAQGIGHLAFRVDDIDAAFAKLRDAGAKVIGDVQQVPDEQVKYSGGIRKRLVYFHDPEGNLLELCEYR